MFFLGLMSADFLFYVFGKKFRILAKCLLMPLLAAFYIFQARPAALLVILALAAATIGDFCLIWAARPLLFQAGLGFFLGGHILYSLLFLQSVDYLRLVPAWFYGLAVPYLGLVYLLYRWLKDDLKQMKPHFMIYGGSLAIMSLLALARIFTLAGWPFWLPFIGSLFFIVSDSLLAGSLFHARLKNGDLLVMSTYLAAQILIVSGLAI